MRGFRRILWIVVPLLVLEAAGLRAGPPSGRTVSNEVVGTEWAAPGDTVGFRVTVRGGAPDASLTIYEQLGSSLTFVRNPATIEPTFEQYCIISALPVRNLPGADPSAPAENRIACSVMTDGSGAATLTLDARVSRHVLAPTRDATTRDVAAVEDLSTDGVESAAAAQIGLVAAPR